MSSIYVCGHKNPDTDSIVSAIAYAALKNAMGERDAVAVRLGEINAETQVVLDRFSFEPPMLINNVKTQLSDVQFDRPPVIGTGVTVRAAWDIMIEYGVQTICIANEDGTLAGTLASGDVAELDMKSALEGLTVDTTAFNLASALEGRLLGVCDECETIRAPLAMHVHDTRDLEAYRGTALISGDREGIIELAQSAGVACLILCEVDANSRAAEEAEKAKIHVILTHYDPYRASRLISHSVPVMRMMRTGNIPVFCVDNFIDDVRGIMLNNRAPSYPVVDADGKVLGTVSRYHLLNHAKKRVIMVDHNEIAQSVTGIEQAELLEIIDHHRIGDLYTSAPVYFRNEPVGSATTIVASMFFEHGVTPSKALAGLISGAIMSDTVMFKSPTCTEKDKRMAYRMSQLAGIDIELLGKEIFSTAANIAQRDASSLVNQDYKEFKLGEHRVGISQVTCISTNDLDAQEEKLLAEMERVRKAHELDYMLLMMTQIVDEFTKLLFTGNVKDIVEDAFGKTADEHSIILPDVLSRKKQVVPAISAVLA